MLLGVAISSVTVLCGYRYCWYGTLVIVMLIEVDGGGRLVAMAVALYASDCLGREVD